jgi:hypothetical protein
MDTVKKIEVFPENSIPEAMLTIGNRLGNVQSEYFFHSYGSHDRETSIMDLNYQWDVNGDGLWEIEFENKREISCRYNKTGKYLVRLKVTDAHADWAVAADTVFVYAGQHETGLLIDKRPELPDYYGIVRIGNLWWMQENLKVEIEPGVWKPWGIYRSCYAGDQKYCSRYGGLYDYSNAGIGCPDGWRLPTKAEFQEMVNLEAPGSMAPLLSGGSSELHIPMGGYIDMEGKSIGVGTIAQFWLAGIAGAANSSVWYFDKIKGESKSAITSQTYSYSVRCVKSD